MNYSVIKGLFGAALAVAMALPAWAQTPAVDFDQGIDVTGVLGELRGEAAHHRYDDPFRDDYRYRDGHRYSPRFGRTERDCATISFRPDDRLVSERVYLESREYEERCYEYPDRDGRTRRNCHEEWVRTYRRNARVEIVGRGEMLPWERDVFEVCLDGDWLTGYVRDASHKYDLDMPGWRGDTVVAHAMSKAQAEPDPHGIRAEHFRFDKEAGNFMLGLADKWAEYYQGETVRLTLKLKRYHKNWFDSTVLTKELDLPAGENYAVNFADYASELSGDLKNGKKYYVKWRFKRVGQVSKDSWQDYRETGKAKYEGATVKASVAAVEEEDEEAEFKASGFWNRCNLAGFEKNMCVYQCMNGHVIRMPLPPGLERRGSRACMQFMESPPGS